MGRGCRARETDGSNREGREEAASGRSTGEGSRFSSGAGGNMLPGRVGERRRERREGT